MSIIIIIVTRDNKKAKTREYEVSWRDKDSITSWVPLIILERMGCINQVNRFEEKLAAQKGLMTRALTAKNVEKHLLGFLKKNRHASAFLDCFTKEPYKGILLRQKNVFPTPHIASFTQETRLKMEYSASKNLIQYLEKN